MQSKKGAFAFLWPLSVVAFCANAAVPVGFGDGKLHCLASLQATTKEDAQKMWPALGSAKWRHYVETPNNPGLMPQPLQGILEVPFGKDADLQDLYWDRKEVQVPRGVVEYDHQGQKIPDSGKIVVLPATKYSGRAVYEAQDGNVRVGLNITDFGKNNTYRIGAAAEINVTFVDKRGNLTRDEVRDWLLEILQYTHRDAQVTGSEEAKPWTPIYSVSIVEPAKSKASGLALYAIQIQHLKAGDARTRWLWENIRSSLSAGVKDPIITSASGAEELLYKSPGIAPDVWDLVAQLSGPPASAPDIYLGKNRRPSTNIYGGNKVHGARAARKNGGNGDDDGEH